MVRPTHYIIDPLSAVKAHPVLYEALQKCETPEEILALRDEVQRQHGRIKDQIHTAIAEAKASGRFADRHWLGRAEGARRLYGQQMEQLNRTAGELRRRLTQQRHAADAALRAHLRKGKPDLRPLPQYFIDVAQEYLQEQLFEELLREARARYAAQAPPRQTPHATAPTTLEQAFRETGL